VLSLASTALGVAAADRYDETMAGLMVKYTGAAYCAGTLGDGVAKWNCAVCKTLPYLNATVVYDKKTNTNGYVGYDKSINAIYVVFAGTDPLSIKNWIDDLNAVTVTVPCPASYGTCKVHKGFYECYLAVRSQIQRAVQNHLKEYPSASIRVSGHSLGGAIAVHALTDLISNMTLIPQTMYTYGEPRVGNPAWQKWFGETIATKTSTFRITHNHDPVPHLPLESMGFRHTPVEVFYDQAQAKYTVCDNSGEDPKCSDKYLADLNVLDHLNYLHFDYTSNYLGCKL